MRIKHLGILSWVHRRRGAEKTKAMRKTARRFASIAKAASGDLAMACEFRMASILPMVAGWGILAPLRATGSLPVIAQLPDCGWTLSCGPLWPALRDGMGIF
jgi:hypothetical protein